MKNQKQINEDAAIIQEFLRSKEKMEKFILEELASIKSPLREKLSRMEMAT